MILLSIVLALPAIFPLYRFSFSFFLSETNQMLDLLLSNPRGLALGIALSVPLIIAGFLLSRETWTGRWLWGARRVTPITYRCLGQMIGGTIFCYFGWLMPEIAFLLACVCLCLFLLVEYSRLNPLPTFRPILRGIADKWIGSAVATNAEAKLYTPTLFFVLGIISSVVLFPSFVIYPLIMATLADPISGLADEYLGRTNLIYSHHKTVEGFFSFVCVGTAALYLLGTNLGLSILVSVGVAFLESLCVRGADNFIVPVSTGFLLRYFGRC